MSTTTTILYSIFYLLGLNFKSMANDVQRFGVSPLSLLVLFCACEILLPWTTILSTAALIHLFYAVRVHIVRILTARTSLLEANAALLQGWHTCHAENITLLQGWRACFEHANSASESLRQDNISFHQGWRGCFEHYTTLLAAANKALAATKKALAAANKALTAANFAVECLKRELVSIRDSNGKLHALIARLQKDYKVAKAAQVKAEKAFTTIMGQLVKSRAEKRELKRTVDQLTEDGEAREVAHQAERTGYELQSQLDQAKITGLQDKICALEARLEAAAPAVPQPAHDAADEALDVQRSDARSQGLAIHTTSLEPRDAAPLEGAVAQLYSGVDDTAVAIHVSEPSQGIETFVHESACAQGIQMTGHAEASPESLPSSPESSFDDSDTPSLTFCDSDAVLDDDPIQNRVYVLSTPAGVHQSYALTTSASAELVPYNTGAVLVMLRAFGHLRSVFAEHFYRYFRPDTSFIV